jgi:hypothetical protein
MSTYLTSLTVVASVTSGDINIAGDVISDIFLEDGNFSDNPEDFIAGIGTATFEVNNSGGLYDPANGSALAGWGIGTTIVINGVFEGVTYPIFTGDIRGLGIDPNPFGRQAVFVTLNDWMEKPARHFVKRAALAADQRIGATMTTLIGLMPNAPTTSTFSTGTRTFKTVFDDIKPNTKAIAEMRKLAVSEWAHVYMKPADELVVEDRESRLGTRERDQVAVNDPFGFLLLDDGASFLVLDDGASKIILEDEELFDIPAGAHLAEYQSDVRYGQNIRNGVIARAYPRDIGSGNEVLYTLGTPVNLPNGKVVTIRGSYKDPVGGGDIWGKDMVALVATTDYLFNEAEDGTGTDITASVTSVTATYYADGFSVSIVVGDVFGWVTKMEPRGIAVRKYNVVESELKDDASQLDNGEFTFAIDQKYQSSNAPGLAEGDAILVREKDPRREIRGLSYSANVSEVNMRAFLQRGIGNLMRLQDTRLTIDSNFYIYARRILIALGGIILFFWVVKQTFTLTDGGLTEVGMEFTGNAEVLSPPSTGTPQVLTYPLNEDFTGKALTVSCRVFLDAADATSTQTIVQITNLGDGVASWFRFGINTDRTIFINNKMYSGTQGLWKSTSATVPLSTWTFVSMSLDFSSSGLDPTIYIDGSSVAVTTSATSAGTFVSVENMEVNMGSHRGFGGIRVWNGKLQHCRVYNKILDATAQTALDANFTDATHNIAGLIFQGPAVYTTEAADRYDTVIGTGAVLENVMGMAGRSDIGGDAITIRELAP